MFSYTRTIFLRDTDATGGLYFTELLHLGLEAMEAFFLSKGFTLQQMLDRQEILMPVVHAEADFFGPILVGDQLNINLKVERIGTTSFTLATEVFRQNISLGATKIVHVVVSRKTNRSIKLPDWLVSHFQMQ